MYRAAYQAANAKSTLLSDAESQWSVKLNTTLIMN